MIGRAALIETPISKMTTGGTIATISFESLVKGREATVRITDDGFIYAVDLVMVVTGKDRDHAGQALRSIPDNIFHSLNFSERQLSTRGGPKTKLVSFKHAIELIMVLPGKIAKETRSQFADVIHRYMAGDGSLADEIHANAKSTAPINEFARSTLGIEEDHVRKRKREALEDRKLEAEVLRLEAEAVSLKRANHIGIMDKYSAVSTDPAIDERARLLFKDTLLNMVTMDKLAITNGPAISISMVASDMGFKPSSRELIKVGIEVKNRYVAKYERDPPKHEQLCDGRVTKVNSYTEADRDLIEQVLQEQLGGEEED